MTQPPTTPGYQSQSMPPRPSGLATASMVVGIVAVCVALIVFCVPPLGGALGVVALILGAIAMSQGGPASAGRGKAGLILGIIAVVISIGWYALFKAGVGFLQRNAPKWQQQMQQKADEMQKQAEEQQKKTQEQMQKQNSTTEPGAAAPSVLPWRIASRFDGMQERTVYLVVPAQA